MARKKFGHLGSEIALLQYGFADELIAAIYYDGQMASSYEIFDDGLVHEIFLRACAALCESSAIITAASEWR